MACLSKFSIRYFSFIYYILCHISTQNPLTPRTHRYIDHLISESPFVSATCSVINQTGHPLITTWLSYVADCICTLCTFEFAGLKGNRGNMLMYQRFINHCWGKYWKACNVTNIQFHARRSFDNFAVL